MALTAQPLVYVICATALFTTKKPAPKRQTERYGNNPQSLPFQGWKITLFPA